MKSNGSVWRAATVAVGLAAAAVLAASAPSAAKVLYEGPVARAPATIRGGEVIAGPHGPAWRGLRGGEDYEAFHGVVVDLAAAGVGRLPRGTLEFWVQRDEVADETPVVFADRDFRSLATIDLLWQGARGQELSIGSGSDYPLWTTDVTDRNTGLPMATTVVPMGRETPRGGWLHVALTWGPAASDCGVYVDGEKLAATVADGFALARLVDDSRYLILGSSLMSGSAAGPESAGNIMRSAIGPVRLHDVGLSASELGLVRVSSVAADQTAYGLGQTVSVTLRGTPDREATFDLEGVVEGAAMEEVDDGVYVGKVVVPVGANGTVALTGRLTDVGTGKFGVAAGGVVTFDTVAPEAVGQVVGSAPWAGEAEVSWTPSASADVERYEVLRVQGGAPLSLAAYASVRDVTFLDTGVVAGLTYRYAVAAVDGAGNRSPASAEVAVTAVAGGGPRVVEIEASPVERPARPGQMLTITVKAQSGGSMTAALQGLVDGIALAEAGRTGVYTGTYAVKGEDVAATRASYPVVAKLVDAYGETLQGGPSVTIVGQDVLSDVTPPAVASVNHDGWKAAGLSGKLVAGDTVTVTAVGEPAGYASVEIPGTVKAVAMKETSPGVYAGKIAIPGGVGLTTLPVAVRLGDEAGNETVAQAAKGLEVDARVRLSVTSDRALLPADRKSGAKLTARAEDANGTRVTGHELVLTLSTTEEYTGVVGGGSVAGQKAALEDVDDVEVKWGGVTDNFGEVSAYTAGFAAKTALLVVKDLTTGDVGAGWLNTYVASTVAIELVPRAQRNAPDLALVRMAAEPARLTADGRSTSRVKLWLTDPNGTPLVGAKVSFTLGNANGRLRSLDATTNPKGLAEAEYRAGTAAGWVTVTAAVTEFGVTGAVQILLTADAPAKVDLAADARRLIADGASKTTLRVAVSDIHDNPNQEVPVSFAVLQGAGTVGPTAVLTDRHGEAVATFTAGRSAGTAIVEARHTSRAPTEQELRRVHGTVFVPRWYERQERDRIKVGEWLVEAGDKVEKGQSLVVVETREGSRVLTAPAKGVFVRPVKHERQELGLGETLGYVEIDAGVWKADYAK